MSRQQLDALVGELTPALGEMRERERLRTPGTGAKDKLTAADRVLATVLVCANSLPQTSWPSSSASTAAPSPERSTRSSHC